MKINLNHEITIPIPDKLSIDFYNESVDFSNTKDETVFIYGYKMVHMFRCPSCNVLYNPKEYHKCGVTIIDGTFTDVFPELPDKCQE